jgi:hypothetical protein
MEIETLEVSINLKIEVGSRAGEGHSVAKLDRVPIVVELQPLVGRQRRVNTLIPNTRIQLLKIFVKCNNLLFCIQVENPLSFTRKIISKKQFQVFYVTDPDVLNEHKIIINFSSD